MLRSILVFALPEEYRDRFFWEITPGVILELTLEVAKNTGHLNDEIDFAGSEGLECRKVDNVVRNSSSLLVTVNSCWLQADCGILFVRPSVLRGVVFLYGPGAGAASTQPQLLYRQHHLHKRLGEHLCLYVHFFQAWFVEVLEGIHGLLLTTLKAFLPARSKSTSSRNSSRHFSALDGCSPSSSGNMQIVLDL